MNQLDLFESPIERLEREVLELKTMLEKIQRGAFARISSVSQDLETLTVHCEVMAEAILSLEKTA